MVRSLESAISDVQESIADALVAQDTADQAAHWSDVARMVAGQSLLIAQRADELAAASEPRIDALEQEDRYPVELAYMGW